MKKILLLIPSMAGAGGTERVVHQMSKLFGNEGFELHQATFDSTGMHRHFSSDVPFYALGPIPDLPLILRPYAFCLSAFRLRKLKRELGIDVCISNLWRADFVNILSGGTDKKIALCHINIRGNISNLLMMKFRPMVAFVYRKFDAVIAVNKSLSTELLDLYRLKAEKTHHIDNFTPRVETATAYPDDGICRFVWCGRFSEEKNVFALIVIWALHVRRDTKRKQLVLIGDGEDRAAAIALAKTEGLTIGFNVSDPNAQIVFQGTVEEPAAYMIDAQSLLLPSKAEGLPMVVLEALALACPVLAADCPTGGLRTALSGDGKCCPNMTTAEWSIAGALLPVPDASDSKTIKPWLEALERARDQKTNAAWREGALLRAESFTPGVARVRWLAVIKRVMAP